MAERPQPVRELIVDRVLSGSTPQERREQKDPRKLGIIIVGGAMAGVGPAGAAKRAAELGIFTAADAIYGNSGGLFAAALVAANQTAQGIKIYYEDINTRDFFDPLRLPESLVNPLATPAVNIKFVTNDVLVNRKPLDTTTLMQSPIPINGNATDAVTGESINFDLTQAPSAQTIRYLLQAGATLPVLSGHPVPLNGRWLYDGGVRNTPIALQQAIDDGCTDLLILHNGMKPQETDKINIIGARIIRKDFGKSADLLIDWADNFKDVLEAIEYWENNPHDDPTPESPNITMIIPQRRVGMLEKRRRLLVPAGVAGENAIDDNFPELVAAKSGNGLTVITNQIHRR